MILRHPSRAALVKIAYFQYIFFLMIRRPPRSTLFPTRRSSDLIVTSSWAHPHAVKAGNTPMDQVGDEVVAWDRSEEHTSELQSPCNLVCRLLLEKKKSFQSAGVAGFFYIEPMHS